LKIIAKHRETIHGLNVKRSPNISGNCGGAIFRQRKRKLHIKRKIGSNVETPKNYLQEC